MKFSWTCVAFALNYPSLKERWYGANVFKNPMKKKTAHAYTYVMDYKPTEWNSNWDGLDGRTSTKSTHLLFLTPFFTNDAQIFREQLLAVVSRMRAYGVPINQVEYGADVRESANALQNQAGLRAGSCSEIPALSAGHAYVPDPQLDSANPVRISEEEKIRNRSQLDNYFLQITRNTTENDIHKIYVCQPHVITYFVSKLLQLPMNTAGRFKMRHGTITWLTILPNGNVELLCMDDAGYLNSNCIKMFGARK